MCCSGEEGRRSRNPTGVELNYLLICPRKLWFFSRNLWMEHTSELVAHGRMLHESSYGRSRKNVKIGRIVIDVIKRGDRLVLREVKRSPAMKDAHRVQLLYYLYQLKLRGIEAIGEIVYPHMRRKEVVRLQKEEENMIKELTRRLDGIKRMRTPPKPVRRKICRSCAYLEFCMV